MDVTGPAPAVAPPPATPRWVVPALAVAALAAYSGVFGHRFLLNWDDLTYVVENEAIRGFSREHLRAVFGRFFFGNYAPLHLLSYTVDYAVWGLRPAGFLLTNVALHAANGCLFFALLRRLGMSVAGAAVAAAVFLLHPVQVESVAWISERKNVLSMTFSLASLHGFVAYRRAATASARWLRYAAALLAFLAALLTKVAAVVVVPALLLLDLCLLPRGRSRRWIRDAAPFALAAAAVIAATLVSQESAVAEGQAVFRMDRATTLFTMAPVVARYVGVVLLPAGLSAMYAPPVRRAPDAVFFASAGLLVAIAVGGGLLWSRRRDVVGWGALFFAALVPVLHLVPLPTLMNDRYLYYPMLGAGALAGLAVERARATRARALALPAAGIVLLALGAAAYVRTEVWRDDLSLWRDVTEKTPQATLGWVGLGRSLVDAGRPAEAILPYTRAVAQDPFHAMALNNLGSTYNLIGRPQDGRPFLLRAIEVQPGYFDAYMNLGIGYRMAGDLAGAEKAFAAAVAARPDALDAASALLDVRLKARRR